MFLEEKKARKFEEGTYEIVTSGVKKDKNGSYYRQLRVRDRDNASISDKKIILWQPLPTIERYRPGNIVKFYNAEYDKEFNSYSTQEKNLDVVEFAPIGLSDAGDRKFRDKLCSYKEKIKDVKLREFINKILKTVDENGNSGAHLFHIAPAAINYHHVYRGGLLVHTVECLEIAEKVLEAIPNSKVNPDELFAACILHDFAKIWEYKYVFDEDDESITINDEFKSTWISHSHWGFYKCMDAGLENVARMIAGHHARTEWGAIVDLDTKNIDPEYYILHHIDDLSAKFGKIKATDLDPVDVDRPNADETFRNEDDDIPF